MTQSPDSGSTPADQTANDADGLVMRYRVAVFAVPDDRESLLPILELLPETTTIDARVRLRDLPGVLPGRLDRETAELLVTKFHDAGVEAALIPETDLPTFEHRPAPHHVRCTQSGIEFVGLGGATELTLPWAELALFSIGVVPVDHSHHERSAPTAVIQAAPGGRAVESDTRAAHGPEMWLVREAPFQAWHIDHLEMNYEYLGDRKSTSAAANFRLFAQDLAESAPAAYRTPSARAYLESHAAEAYHFVSREAHAKTVQLHVLLRRSMQRPS